MSHADIRSGPIEWTLSLAGGALTASDDMGGDAGRMATFSAGETLPYHFVFGHDDSPDGFARLLGHADYAGSDNYDIYKPVSGPPHYRDQSAGHTLLVGIDAHYRDGSPVGPDYPLAWGVLDNVEDVSPDRGPRKVDVDVFVLARRGDYPDRAAVRNALEASGP